MKKSNILLLAFSIYSIISIFYVNYTTKTAFMNKSVFGNKKIERITIDTLNTEQIYFERGYDYILNPNSKDIVIEAESNLLPLVCKPQNDTLFKMSPISVGFEREGCSDIDPAKIIRIKNHPITVIIGVKNVKNLSLIIRENVKIDAQTALVFDSLFITLSYFSTDFAISLNCKYLSVDAREWSKINLAGQVKTLKLNLDDSAEFDGSHLKIRDANTVLLKESRAKMIVQNVIKGFTEENTILNVLNDPKTNNVVRQKSQEEVVNEVNL